LARAAKRYELVHPGASKEKEIAKKTIGMSG